jgi:hypothetical protein
MYTCEVCLARTERSARYGEVVDGRLVQLTVARCCRPRRYGCYVCGKPDATRRLMVPNTNVMTYSCLEGQCAATLYGSDVDEDGHQLMSAIGRSTGGATTRYNPDRPGFDLRTTLPWCTRCKNPVEIRKALALYVGVDADYSRMGTALQIVMSTCSGCRYPAVDLGDLCCVHCGKPAFERRYDGRKIFASELCHPYHCYHTEGDDGTHIWTYACYTVACRRAARRMTLDLIASENLQARIEVPCMECCLVLDRPSWCSRCRSVAYCNQTCQRANWEVHKRMCVSAPT